LSRDLEDFVSKEFFKPDIHVSIVS
jgi:hypothetical protein